MERQYYTTSFSRFCSQTPTDILGQLTKRSEFAVEPTQVHAWNEQTRILQGILRDRSGDIYFEYSIPRMGRRVDALLLTGPVIFVLEFKVGEDEYPTYAHDQVWDYALELKNFHSDSHSAFIAPILVCTNAPPQKRPIIAAQDKVLAPLYCNEQNLQDTISRVLAEFDGPPIDTSRWAKGHYHPTPTIVEAAMALYAGHSVKDISRNDAGAINLSQTSDALSRIILDSQQRSRKSICFLTGVPGAGKTLVGLNIANQHTDKKNELYSVFLSGNGPLVDILREALSRDRVRAERAKGQKLRKSDAFSAVKMFIQNVHNFRDDCLVEESRAPIEHVALFDEAQRAWDLPQTANFMRRKKGRPNFNMSEPEFLISCLDRHRDWAVVVCLVGGGQEINVGESGISEWVDSLERSFKNWDIHISPNLTDSEYAAGEALKKIKNRKNVSYNPALHLATSMRSFRAEHVSSLVKNILDMREAEAKRIYEQMGHRYPIVLTRDISKAKKWLRSQARGTERYGIVASSQATRLKPHAIDVRAPMDPVHWFLDGKEDIRSSYYLEDVATEFHVQGLELDWACVSWDADFRYTPDGWGHFSFVGDRWNNIKKSYRQDYLKNSYRVLLTRARQGMVILVPDGAAEDPTRASEFYDPTFDYLSGLGIPVLK